MADILTTKKKRNNTTVQENRRNVVHDRVVPIAREQEAMLRSDHRYVELFNKINSWEYRRSDDQHFYRCEYQIAIVVPFTFNN